MRLFVMTPKPNPSFLPRVWIIVLTISAAACQNAERGSGGPEKDRGEPFEYGPVAPQPVDSEQSRPEPVVPEHGQKDSTKSYLNQVCQLTLDHASLQPYFHVDTLPERKPMRVLVNNSTDAKLELSKFGMPVMLLSADQALAEGVPYFVFTEISIDAERAQVTFEYPVEGIRGIVRFQRSGNDWKTESFQLVEK